MRVLLSAAAVTVGVYYGFASVDVVGQEMAKGERLFRLNCLSCHAVKDSGPAILGPPIGDILGKRIGAANGFTYSAAFKELYQKNIIWDDDKLAAFLRDPLVFAPGSEMKVKVESAESIRSIIQYLKSVE